MMKNNCEHKISMKWCLYHRNQLQFVSQSDIGKLLRWQHKFIYSKNIRPRIGMNSETRTVTYTHKLAVKLCYRRESRHAAGHSTKAKRPSEPKPMHAVNTSTTGSSRPLPVC